MGDSRAAGWSRHCHRPKFDYQVVTGTLTLAAGATERTIVVPILNDALHDLAETFGVTLAAGELRQSFRRLSLRKRTADAAGMEWNDTFSVTGVRKPRTTALL